MGQHPFRRKLRSAGVSVLKAVLANDHLDRMASEAMAKTEHPLTERIIVNQGIKFYCIGNTAQWRAETLFTKERETIEWIDTFARDDVFWDIGANVGCYSLYAAARGITTYAFEPAAANFYLLSRNIELNGFHKKLKAFPVAVGVNTGYGWIKLSSYDFAAAEHGLMANLARVIDSGQGVYCDTVDGLVTQLGQAPQHIKIDVDGIEQGILNNALGTLPFVKSLQVEGRQPLNINGFKLVSSRQSEMFRGTMYAGILNHRYVRET